MGRRVHLTETDKRHIIDNYKSRTLKDIANDLNRDVRTIRKFINEAGLDVQLDPKKQKQVILSKDGIKGVKTINKKEVFNLSEYDKKEFFKEQLKNSLYYNELKQQFTDKEIDYYLQEWGELCTQFTDIVSTEKRQIDEFIKAEIMGNRILRNIKIANDEHERIAKEIDSFRKKHKEEDIISNDLLQERDQMLMNLVRMIGTNAEIMAKHYKESVELRNKMLGELHARRSDRIDQLKNRGITFIGVIEEIRQKDIRDRQSRYAELSRMAKEKKSEKLREPYTFLDGTREGILIDEKFKDTKNQDSSDRIIKDFMESNDMYILVIDDDMYRKQFFAELFKNNNLNFASNVDKALIMLQNNPSKISLICLDYDLGMDQKGDQFVDYIIENNLCKDTYFLIHSNNPEGVKIIINKIKGHRLNVTMSFAEIYKQYKENKNGKQT